jgi:diguanylate cyclase (GGDEF)-like protein
LVNVQDRDLAARIRSPFSALGHAVTEVDSTRAVSAHITATPVDLLVFAPQTSRDQWFELLSRLVREQRRIPAVILTSGEQTGTPGAPLAVAADTLALELDCAHLSLLPGLAADLVQRCALLRENQHLMAALHRLRSEHESARVRILEHRQRLMSQEKVRTVLELTGASSQRLNQPLSVLLGNVELLLSRMSGNQDNIVRLVERMVSSAHEINTIVRRVQNLHHHRLQVHLEGDHFIDQNRDRWRVLVGVTEQEQFEQISAALGRDRERLDLIWRATANSAGEDLASGEIDVALLDLHLPGGDAMALIQEEAEKGFTTPIIVLADSRDDAMIGEALHRGASDWLPWSLLSSESVTQSVRLGLRLAQTQACMAPLEEQLRTRAAIDPVTGLTTPPRLHSLLEEEFERARRHRRPLTLLAFEIDGWVAIRERNSDQAISTFLIQLGRRLSERARQADCFSQISDARYVAILPETAAASVNALTARLDAMLSECLAEQCPPHELKETVLTLSHGVCDLDGGTAPERADELLHRAVDALESAQAEKAGSSRIWDGGALTTSAQASEIS